MLQPSLQWYIQNGMSVENMPPIRIQYEGKKYEVYMIDAYDLNKDIQLPDGRILRPGGWLESYPPQTGGLKEVVSDNVTLAKEVE